MLFLLHSGTSCCLPNLSLFGKLLGIHLSPYVLNEHVAVVLKADRQVINVQQITYVPVGATNSIPQLQKKPSNVTFKCLSNGDILIFLFTKADFPFPEKLNLF